MGGVSADGKVLWLSGRYNAAVYAISTDRRSPHRARSRSATDRTGCASGPSPGATPSATPASPDSSLELARDGNGFRRHTRMISYFQAIVIGLLQGVTELFPISSLGHSVLVPGLARAGTPGHAPVGRRVALPRVRRRAARRDRARAARLLPSRLGPDHRGVLPHAADPDARDTRRADGVAARSSRRIPAGITGLALEHTLRTLFAKPLAAAIFLTVNGVILLFGERVRRRVGGPRARRDARDRAQRERRGPTARHARLQGGGRRRRRADRRAVRRHQPVGHHDGRRTRPRPRPRGRGALLVPARDADHPRGRASTRSPTSPATSATASAARRSSAASSRRSPRSSSVRFLVRFFETRNLLPFAIYCLRRRRRSRSSASPDAAGSGSRLEG